MIAFRPWSPSKMVCGDIGLLASMLPTFKWKDIEKMASDVDYEVLVIMMEVNNKQEDEGL